MTFGKRPQSPESLRTRSDGELCRDVAKGNHEAFLVLFDRYWMEVFQLARAILRNDAEAEDLVQGLFLEMHRTMLRFDEQRGSFRTLLLRYAYTRAIDHKRHLESRRYYATVQIEELAQENMACEKLLTAGLTLEESTYLIGELLELLDEKQRAVVQSYFFEGLSLHEIAEQLDASYGNARHYLYRGLERMRHVLANRKTEAELRDEAARAALRLEDQIGNRVVPEVSGA